MLTLARVPEHRCSHRYKIFFLSNTGYFKYPSTIWCPFVSVRPLHGTVPEFLNSGVSAWKEKVCSH